MTCYCMQTAAPNLGWNALRRAAAAWTPWFIPETIGVPQFYHWYCDEYIHNIQRRAFALLKAPYSLLWIFSTWKLYWYQDWKSLIETILSSVWGWVVQQKAWYGQHELTMPRPSSVLLLITRLPGLLPPLPHVCWTVAVSTGHYSWIRVQNSIVVTRIALQN